MNYVNGKFITMTDKDAPLHRIVKIDPYNSSPDKWVDMVPQQKMSMQRAHIVGKKLFVVFLKDAAMVVNQYDLNGKFEKEIQLPGLGSIYGFYGKMNDKILFYTFASFTYPHRIFKYNIRYLEATKSSILGFSTVSQCICFFG